MEIPPIIWLKKHRIYILGQINKKCSKKASNINYFEAEIEMKKKKTSWLALQFSLVNQPQKATFIYQDRDCLHWGMLMAEVINTLLTVGPKNYSPSLCKVCKSPKGKIWAISSLKGGLKLIQITFQLFQPFTS